MLCKQILLSGRVPLIKIKTLVPLIKYTARGNTNQLVTFFTSYLIRWWEGGYRILHSFLANICVYCNHSQEGKTKYNFLSSTLCVFWDWGLRGTPVRCPLQNHKPHRHQNMYIIIMFCLLVVCPYSKVIVYYWRYMNWTLYFTICMHASVHTHIPAAHYTYWKKGLPVTTFLTNMTW